MSLEYSDIPPHKSRTVTPCFCCKMKKKNFFIMANSTLFIVSLGLLTFALVLLFEFNIIFAALALVILASLHLIISLVSFLKYSRYKTVGTRFHKWQAIGNIIFSLIMFILFSCTVVFVLILTLKSDLKDPVIWNNLAQKFALLVGGFPLLVFYTYWSLLFMRIVPEKRQLYLTNIYEEQAKSNRRGESSVQESVENSV